MKIKLTLKSTFTSLFVGAMCCFVLPNTGYAQIINTFAGTGSSGYTGDGASATSAKMNNPSSVATDNAGNVYICDFVNNAIRKVDLSGTITTIAGTGVFGYTGDGGPATSAELSQPNGVAVDGDANIYIVDYGNNVVRKVDHATGIITTVVGTGTSGYSGDGGLATLATLNRPLQLDVDNMGNMYIADHGNEVIRKVDHATSVITTVVGTGVAGFSGDGGPATSAEMDDPSSVELDNAGNMYIADTHNTVIRKVDASGTISTVAGLPGSSGYNGDNIQATTANLQFPGDVQVDASGNLYISDGDYRIRKVDASGIITTIAGNGNLGYTGDGGLATAATINNQGALGFNADYSIMYIADRGNNVIRSVTIPCNNVVVPGVAVIVAPGNTVSMGQTVTFTATVTNGGLAPTYNWLKNNVSTGNTNATYVTNSIAEGDVVKCIVHSNATCATPDSAVSNIETMHITSAVQNVLAVNSFSLYPNPNQGSFSIEGVVNSNNGVQAEVMNVTGQIVYTTTLPATNHYVKAQITLPANMASGIYQLRLRTDDASQVQRFTIEK